jgi:hypothetical protein
LVLFDTMGQELSSGETFQQLSRSQKEPYEVELKVFGQMEIWIGEMILLREQSLIEEVLILTVSDVRQQL